MKLKIKLQDLSQTVQKIGEQMYKSAGGGNQAGPGNEKPEDKGPEEGQYKEKKIKINFRELILG